MKDLDKQLKKVEDGSTASQNEETIIHRCLMSSSSGITEEDEDEEEEQNEVLSSSFSSSSVSEIDEKKEKELTINKEKFEWLSSEFCQIGCHILNNTSEPGEKESETTRHLFENFIIELSSMSFKMGEDVQPISFLKEDSSPDMLCFWNRAAAGAYEERWNFHNTWLEKMNMTDCQRSKWFELVDHVQRVLYPVAQRLNIFQKFIEYVEHVIRDTVNRDAMHWLDLSEYPNRQVDADGNPYE